MKTTPVIERVMRRIVVDPVTECWLWPGWKDRHGYGFVRMPKSSTGPKDLRVHRVTYQHLVGPIPDGLVLDHLCRVTSCCNPAHLEAVTDRINILRGESSAARAARRDHCVNGHPYDEQNTYRYANGVRKCKTCRREQERQRQQRKREAS